MYSEATTLSEQNRDFQTRTWTRTEARYLGSTNLAAASSSTAAVAPTRLLTSTVTYREAAQVHIAAECPVAVPVHLQTAAGLRRTLPRICLERNFSTGEIN